MTTHIDCAAVPATAAEQAPEVALAARQLETEGFALLDHVLAADRVDALHEACTSRLAAELEARASGAEDRDQALRVGDRRFLFTLELSGPFADPLVYANPTVLAIATAVLGDAPILESFGTVVSLPGSKDQHRHRDGSALFAPALTGLLPAYALTVVFPLIPMNTLHGTTALWPGTHRYRAEVGDDARVVPELPVGSCGIWDFRTEHAGTGNRSDRPRPILYCTYAKRWWRDADNYRGRQQRRLAVPAATLAAAPEPLRHLFAHLDGDGRTG